MTAFLFDASAAVCFYTEARPRAKDVIQRVLELRESLPCILYIPNLCIPEVLNALTKLKYEPENLRDRVNRVEYDSCINKFKRDVHWGRLFYPYDLNRYHILAVDEIIPFEYEVKREPRPNKDKKYDRLSAFDILVIAMASELAYTHGVNNVALLTGDSRMKRVCEAMRITPPKDRKRRRLSGFFADIPAQRWPIPSVFDIYHDDPQLIRQIIQGKPAQGLRA
jgi:phosphate/sulfate permease